MTAVFFEINGALIFRVSGKDSLRYLNARLSNDIRTVSPGVGILAAALTAQGRVEALFSVSLNPDGSYLLICDGGDRASVLAALRRFIVADRVEIEDLSADCLVLHLISDAAAINLPGLGLPAEQPYAAANSGTLTVIRRARSRHTGLDLVGPRAEVAILKEQLLKSQVEAWSEERARFERFSAAIPAFPEELGPEMLLLEAGLTTAVSFNKGCYVGQEVLEKLESHGKAPRRLVLLKVAGPRPPIGAAVRGAPGSAAPVLGKVSSAVSAPDGQGFLCFALLKNQDSPGPLEIEGQAATVLPAP